MKYRMILLPVLLTVAGLSIFTIAQRLKGDHNHTSHAGMSHSMTQEKQSPEIRPLEDPPDTIYGSKTPWLISDEKAYEVFFNAVAVPKSASEMTKAYAKEKFRRAQLNEEDTGAVMRILSEFHDKRAGIAHIAERLNAKREAEKSEVEKNIAKLSGAEKEAAQKEAAQKDAEQKELLNNEFKRLHSELASIESSTGQALKSQLSPEGEAKLRKYVMDLKQKIKILPGLPKPSPTP